MFSLDRICSLRAPLTGRSNPLGLKSILKVITLIARSAPFVTKAKSNRGDTTPSKIETQFYQRKEFVEEAASATSLRLAVRTPTIRPNPRDKVRFFDFAQNDR